MGGGAQAGGAMNGLINRSIQCFLRDGWGAGVWDDAARAAGVPPQGFEPLLPYPPEVTDRLLAAAAARLDRDSACLLEDLGTYIVSHPARAAVRRLLRFGGSDFRDFLHSLEDLPARARLALPDLVLPPLHLREETADAFRLVIGPGRPGLAEVMLGLLRAMADDYGALVLLRLDHAAADGAADVVIHLLDPAHGAGRAFRLGRGS